MISNLMMLYLLTGDEDLREKAQKTGQAFGATIAKNIFSHLGLLGAAIDIMSPTHLVILSPNEDETTAKEMIALAQTLSIPNIVIELIKENNTLPPSSPAHGKTPLNGKSTAYLCTGTHCQAPITNTLDLLTSLKEAVKAKP